MNVKCLYVTVKRRKLEWIPHLNAGREDESLDFLALLLDFAMPPHHFQGVNLLCADVMLALVQRHDYCCWFSGDDSKLGYSTSPWLYQLDDSTSFSNLGSPQKTLWFHTPHTPFALPASVFSKWHHLLSVAQVRNLFVIFNSSLSSPPTSNPQTSVFDTNPRYSWNLYNSLNTIAQPS